jgi:hypothetical protein
MGSNNYAEVITDSTKPQQVVAGFESMAAQGSSFKVLQFNPELDRFNISCWRESNFPTLLDVEESGTTMDCCRRGAVEKQCSHSTSYKLWQRLLWLVPRIFRQELHRYPDADL